MLSQKQIIALIGCVSVIVTRGRGSKIQKILLTWQHGLGSGAGIGK